jgi:putative transposase
LAKSKDDGYDISVKRRCGLLGINRSTLYYKPKEKKCPLRKMCKEGMEKRMKEIDRIHTALPAQGARKMARDLTGLGMPTNRYGAARLMEMMDIRCIYPKPNTSKPGREHIRFPYLLKNKRIWLPNQVWAIDITYVPYKGGHMYLTAIIDWYSRMVVGIRLTDSLHNAPVLACTKEAFERYGIPSIMNSDQGGHFTSKAYIELLAGLDIAQSMNGKSRWVHNKIIERWFRTLKTEYIYINDFESPRELKAGIAEFVEKYNMMRRHESHDYKTPLEVWSEPFAKAA